MTRDLSAREVFEQIIAIEGQLDLEDPLWRTEDIHWWPAYRLELYRLMTKGPRIRPREDALQQIRPAIRCAQLSRLAALDSDTLLVTEGSSWISRGGTMIDRLAGPVAAAFDASGNPATIADRGSTGSLVSDSAAIRLAPLVQRHKLLARLRSAIRSSSRHATLVSAVAQAAARAGANVPIPSSRRMSEIAIAVGSIARAVRPALERSGVRRLLVVSYYNIGGYAFTLAARRCGIPVIDIQHGATGPFHPGYSEWPRDHEMLSLIPDGFWCWSEQDAQVISPWATSLAPRRFTVVGGHPFLQAWMTGMIRPEADDIEVIERLRADSGARHVGLVTMQPGFSDPDSLEPLVGAMSRLPDMAWWIRMHPLALGDQPDAVSVFRQTGADCVIFDDVTAVSLTALLEAVDCHLTHSSSVVIESSLMGVPSIVFSRYGAELYAGADPELVRVAVSAAAIQDAIVDLAAGKCDGSDTPRMNAAVEALLKVSRS